MVLSPGEISRIFIVSAPLQKTPESFELPRQVACAAYRGKSSEQGPRPEIIPEIGLPVEFKQLLRAGSRHRDQRLGIIIAVAEFLVGGLQQPLLPGLGVKFRVEEWMGESEKDMVGAYLHDISQRGFHGGQGLAGIAENIIAAGLYTGLSGGRHGRAGFLCAEAFVHQAAGPVAGPVYAES